MRRLVAALIAIGMVVAALAIRSLIDDTVEENKSPVRLACAPELASVCQAVQTASNDKLTFVVESPALTADKLAKLAEGAAPQIDAWLAPQPWATSVNDGRARAGSTALLDIDDATLARSPLLVVVWNDRAQPLAASCPQGAVGWKCLGELAGTSWSDQQGQATWGRVKIGHSKLGADGVGLLAFGQAVAGWFGRTDISRADLEADDTYASWVRNLEGDVRANANNTVTTPLDRMATQGRSAYDVAATTEAQAATLFTTSPSFASAVRTIYPSPVGTADLRVVTVRQAPGASRAQALLRDKTVLDALSSAGWRTEPNSKPVGATAAAPPSLPKTHGLPADGLLDYLYRTWKES